jgi:peptide/nickel transport system substrate-binding protein
MRLEPSDITSSAATYNRIGLALFSTGYHGGLGAKDENENPYPLLVEALPRLNTASWRVFPDGGMETTFRLKPGLTWHDGTALTAEDFAFTHRALNAQTEWGLINPIIELPLMQEVQAPDDRTVVIRWRQIYADAATPDLTPYARHILAAAFSQGEADAFASHPYWTTEYVGIGPYRLIHWERGAYLEGSAFAGYALGAPKIERVRVTWSADPNVTATRLMAGDLHLAVDSALLYQQAASLRKTWQQDNSGVILLIPRSLRWVQVQHRPAYVSPRALIDVRTRKALIHALDREAIADAMFEGAGLVAQTMGPPTLSFYDELLRVTTNYPYDLRQTEQLMAEVGYTKGGDGFYTSQVAGRFAPEMLGLAEGDEAQQTTIVADYLRRAGIDAGLRLAPAAQLAQSDEMKATFPGLRSNYTGGTVDMGQQHLITSRIAGPENRWRATNRIGWSTPEHDRLFEAWSGALDRTERNQLMIQMLRTVNEELPGLPLYFELSVTAHTGALEGPRTIAPDSTAYGNLHEWIWR